MEKKVLYITYDGLTDPLGQSQILPYLLELSKRDVQFTILSFEKSERLQVNREVINRLIENTNIKWVPLTFTSKPPVISKVYDLWRMKKTSICLHKKHNFSLVHCRSYVAAQVALYLKQKYSVPFIFDMRGFWADEKKESGRWKFLYKYYKRLEAKFLRNADAVVSLTYAAKKEMQTWNLQTKLTNEIVVIPCCADFEHFSSTKIDEVKRTQIKSSWKLSESYPVICYLGSLGAAYGISEMLQYFNLLKQKFPSAKFLFLTKDDRAQVLNLLSQYQYISETDLHFEYVNRSQLPTYLSIVDFSIFFYYPTYSRLACSPTKFAELAAMGIPVICNSVGDLNKEFLNRTPHIVIDDLSEESMKASIDKIVSEYEINRSNIREFALQRFSLEKGVESYQNIYQNIIKCKL